MAALRRAARDRRGRCDASASQANESLGVVEVELLRRVNAELEGFRRPVDRGVWIRGYLAQGQLVPRNGEKFWPSPERVQELRARGDRAVDEMAAAGYDVIGDLDDLRTPAELPDRRHPDSVTDAELAEAGAATIASMLTDVRRLTTSARGCAGAGAGLTCEKGRTEGASIVAPFTDPLSRRGTYSQTTPYDERTPMGRLCETDGLTEDQQEILKAVRTFVEDKILPVATELEHADEYPQRSSTGSRSSASSG